MGGGGGHRYSNFSHGLHLGDEHEGSFCSPDTLWGPNAGFLNPAVTSCDYISSPRRVLTLGARLRRRAGVASEDSHGERDSSAQPLLKTEPRGRGRHAAARIP